MEHLNTLFSAAKIDAEAFTALLDQEHKALVDRDMPALEELLAEKAPLVSALSQHDRAIIAYCQQAGIQPGESLEQHLAVTQPLTLLSTYQAFKEALQRCQIANERNARLIRHSQQATAQLLDLLRNQGESSQNIYDSQGLASKSGTPRNLTKV
ncbi:flagella synthesis protein FlgN [Halopseudomonas pelagia]|uniref:flagella synthesis protein FlgN n=1 Tax=Halopseudomonas pelagia TaxID=553151 RepID=UPI0003A07E19|nr:flagellar protein FlgN [Halopseudomonas pelagia]|tara:strand:+ start:981 stop:1442 length:462 start_codon:yes stop_codon:yes gene_type:complete